MVWIHGGGFILGSGGSNLVDIYNGKEVAARGNVVVVSINYRLGALGNMKVGGWTNCSLSLSLSLSLFQLWRVTSPNRTSWMCRKSTRPNAMQCK